MSCPSCLAAPGRVPESRAVLFCRCQSLALLPGYYATLCCGETAVRVYFSGGRPSVRFWDEGASGWAVVRRLAGLVRGMMGALAARAVLDS